MRKVRVEQAIGLELCHDITEMRDDFKGAAFKRGHTITEGDIPKLLSLGKKQIFVWEEEAGEIHEEEAANRLSQMNIVDGAHYTKPSEGKVLLMADKKGMFRIDTELLKEINSIGDITIASLPDHYPVEEGMRLASMRIVPLVTKEEQIVHVERLCAERKLMDLRPYQHMKVGVVITGSELFDGRIEDKFEPVVRGKMKKYPSEILGVTICDDNLEMIVEAAKDFINKGAELLIFSGGMSVDPDDVTPEAIRTLGADIVSYGVPAQPGNMTLVAYLDDTAILGVPGAAISLPTTIFDVLLPQIFTRDKLTKEDLIRLGDGGICQLCEICHFPNCTFGRY